MLSHFRIYGVWFRNSSPSICVRTPRDFLPYLVSAIQPDILPDIQNSDCSRIGILIAVNTKTFLKVMRLGIRKNFDIFICYKWFKRTYEDTAVFDKVIQNLQFLSVIQYNAGVMITLYWRYQAHWYRPHHTLCSFHKGCHTSSEPHRYSWDLYQWETIQMRS